MKDEHKKDERTKQNAQSTGASDAQNNETSPQQYDELLEQTDKERTRKPGSQSNSSGQHNNGRGGGK